MESPKEQSPEPKDAKVTKTPKRGIVYLSTIPPYMNVLQIQEYFGQFGKLGRVYLQLADPGEPSKPGEKKSKKRKVSKKFTEGWVEFERKSVAKKVASMVNNMQVNTRKKSKQYDSIWNIKYLPHFKWTHLHERLAYEKAARRQKLRAEVSLAKKKATYFTNNLDTKKKSKQVVVGKELNNLGNKEGRNKVEEIESKEDVEETVDDRAEFLESLFT